jgi:hypothetical protein
VFAHVPQKPETGWKTEFMRPSKSRSRGKNRSPNRSPANNLNRVFDSSGPEGKVRGTPQQIIDKYGQLARDAFLGNDRVAAENFQQHAEHYTRLLSEAQNDAEEKRLQAEQANRDRQQQQQQQQKQRDERSRARDDAASESADTDPGAAAQPDIVEPSDEDSGLVETPETKARPRRAPRPRKPKAEAAPSSGDDATEAAE